MIGLTVVDIADDVPRSGRFRDELGHPDEMRTARVASALFK